MVKKKRTRVEPKRVLPERIEYCKFSKDDLLELAKSLAKMRLIGSIYIGHILKQDGRWLPDGSVEVLTYHQPSAEWDALVETPHE